MSHFIAAPPVAPSLLASPRAPTCEEVYAHGGFLPPPFPGGRLMAFFELLRDRKALRALTGEPAA